MVMLGEMAMDQELIDPNAKSGIFHYNKKAAELRYPNAHYNLGVFFKKEIAIDPDVEKAISWYEKATSTGVPQAAKALRGLKAKLCITSV